LETQQKRPKNSIFNLRISDQLRERVETLAAENGRTKTAEVMRLIEKGLDLSAMTGGRHADLLTDLFAAVISPTEGAPASRLLAVIDRHFSRGEVETAMLNVQRRHAQ
jgi:hypothetical protein